MPPPSLVAVFSVIVPPYMFIVPFTISTPPPQPVLLPPLSVPLYMLKVAL